MYACERRANCQIYIECDAADVRGKSICIGRGSRQATFRSPLESVGGIHSKPGLIRKNKPGLLAA